MSATTRKLIEDIYLGEDEAINDFNILIPTTWCTDPASPTLVIKDSYGTDVTSTCTDGSPPTVTGQTIYLPLLTGKQYRVNNSLSAGGITPGPAYRLEVKFTAGGSTFECWTNVYGQE